jgi:hypothetical protein
MAWPPRLDFGQMRNFNLDSLYFQKERFEADPSRFTQFHEPSDWLLGYAIPSFQRPVVWSEEQMVRFVESAILGVNLDTYTFNRTSDHGAAKNAAGQEVWPMDLWLIDGQQRLTALDRYWSDAFPVFGSFWSEVPENDRRRFGSTGFAAYETNIVHELELRRLYDKMNFGGTPHLDEQRALPDEPDF